MPDVAGDIFPDSQVFIIDFVFLADDLRTGSIIVGSGCGKRRGRHLFKCSLKLFYGHRDFLHRLSGFLRRHFSSICHSGILSSCISSSF